MSGRAFHLGDHLYDAQRDLLLSAIRANDPLKVENFAKLIRLVANEKGIDVGLGDIIKDGREFIETIRAAAEATRPKTQDQRISKYERELPEADAVYAVNSPTLRDRGWSRLQRNIDDYGDSLPWRKTEKLFRLRPSETTIWAGPNGSLKSATVNFILGHLAFAGVKTFVASFELTADDQIARLSTQMLVNPLPVKSRYDALVDSIGENLTIYDFVGQIKPSRALALARYAATDLKAKHVLIDNLTMVCPPSRDVDELAARFVAGLYQIGRDTGAHMHLIAHVRKPDDDTRQLSRYDIRGTGAAPDMVDNVVLMQRNEAKQRSMDSGSGDRSEEPDLYVKVDKQRHASFRGRLGFWFHETSLRLLESGVDQPKAYC